MRVHTTRWIGIFIQEEEGHYWLTESQNGCDWYIGTHWPTKSQRKQFRNALNS